MSIEFCENRKRGHRKVPLSFPALAAGERRWGFSVALAAGEGQWGFSVALAA